MPEREEQTTRVLLVDDEEEFLRPLCRRLARRGFAVCGAPGGGAALAHLEENPVDVVVLDLTMPGMDGMAVLKELKSRRPGLEVILLSGRAGLNEALAGMAAGAFDYLLKPADIDRLVYKLQDAAAKTRLYRRGKTTAAGGRADEGLA